MVTICKVHHYVTNVLHVPSKMAITHLNAAIESSTSSRSVVMVYTTYTTSSGVQVKCKKNVSGVERFTM